LIKCAISATVSAELVVKNSIVV